MPNLNENYLKLQENYLFSEIAHRVAAYTKQHPEKNVIRLGIEDVTRPLCQCAGEALLEGAKEMMSADTFKGYGPEQGYEDIRKAIVDYYKRSGVEIDASAVFVSDGAKSDTGNITDLFAHDNVILIPTPVYPVYVDSNVMCGNKVEYIEGNADNDFLPMPDWDQHADIIYICSPNNPTGACYNKSQLKEWVDYALKNQSVILFDAAYEAYIAQEDVPHSIYECDGARTCAIELRSFSKNAGFTGLRLAYTVVPGDLKAGDVALNGLWARRHGTKYNGAPYIVQRAGEAVYSKEGKQQILEMVGRYMKNAHYILEGLKGAGYEVYGGVNSPYVWMKTPDRMTSWEFFDYLLEKANVVGTPGSGFGPSGEHYFRLTAFGSYENTVEAVERIKGI